MQIDICCNTEDETLFQNIEINSRRDLEWISEVPAHDGHAVIVGGGPSLKDSIETIRWRQGLGQKVFALNGAAKFLSSQGIQVDYLVVLDAREANASFLSLCSVKHALFASQCHPRLLDIALGDDCPDECKAGHGSDEVIHLAAPNFVLRVSLWHPKIDGIEDHLPDRRESLTLIGGGTTVGLSAMCLAYTMGYRKLHLFGYDSSHKEDEGHAYAQPMNDKEPVCKVTVFGKTFKSSLAMAKQAEFFPTVSDNLIDLGCVITVDGDGLLPFVVREIAKRANAAPMTEQEKYQAMWTLPEYRSVAPGEHVADAFVQLSGVGAGDIVIDFGCGTGRGAKRVHELAGCDMILTDFTDNSLDDDLRGENWYTFYRHDLTEPLKMSAKHGFCTDVMEHIPPEQVDTVISNIMRATERVFFQISLVDDVCGALIGQPLHLSVHPMAWWADKFKELGYTVEWSQDQDIAALFYVAR